MLKNKEFCLDYCKFKPARNYVQMANVYRPGHLPLVREVWGSNPEPIKSHTLCQRLATAATLMYGPGARPRRCMDTARRDTLSGEYNDDLIFLI